MSVGWRDPIDERALNKTWVFESVFRTRSSVRMLSMDISQGASSATPQSCPQKLHARDDDSINRPNKKTKTAHQGRPVIVPTVVFHAKACMADGEQQGILNRSDSAGQRRLLEANELSLGYSIWEEVSEEIEEETPGELEWRAASLEVRCLEEDVSAASPSSVDATSQQGTSLGRDSILISFLKMM
eukprot:scaffold4531_cov103-Cylindrotheca_fusiformis.AAC.10